MQAILPVPAARITFRSPACLRVAGELESAQFTFYAAKKRRGLAGVSLTSVNCDQESAARRRCVVTRSRRSGKRRAHHGEPLARRCRRASANLIRTSRQRKLGHRNRAAPVDSTGCAGSARSLPQTERSLSAPPRVRSALRTIGQTFDTPQMSRSRRRCASPSLSAIF